MGWACLQVGTCEGKDAPDIEGGVRGWGGTARLAGGFTTNEWLMGLFVFFIFFHFPLWGHEDDMHIRGLSDRNLGPTFL